jgi:hypothetical protein
VGEAANVLYEAGVTVVLLRTQRERLHEVLDPLRDFRPKEWPEARRTERLPAFERSPAILRGGTR